MPADQLEQPKRRTAFSAFNIRRASVAASGLASAQAERGRTNPIPGHRYPAASPAHRREDAGMDRRSPSHPPKAATTLRMPDSRPAMPQLRLQPKLHWRGKPQRLSSPASTAASSATLQIWPRGLPLLLPRP